MINVFKIFENLKNIMMKKILLLCIWLLVVGSSMQGFSQNGCDWTLTNGSSQNDYIHKVTTDNLGNVLLAISFKDTLIFGTDTAFSHGNYDGIIAKISPTGSLLWAQQIAGASNNMVYSVSVDALNNVYIAGSFSGTAYFGTTINHSSQGGEDLYVAKLSSSGSWQWVKPAGNSASQICYDVKAAPWSGDVLVSGTFAGKIYFNTDSVTSAGLNDGFVGSLSSSTGNWNWIKTISGSSDISVLSMDAHASGLIALAGAFSGTATLGTYNLNSSGGTDGFAAAINSSGTFQWAVKAGGNANDSAYSVKFIPSGKIYLAGSFRGIAQFGTNILSSSGGSDAFTGLLSSSGSWLWALRAGGTGDDIATSISADANGFGILAGEYSGLASFGIIPLTSAGGKDIFVSRLDSSGAWLWAFRQGGSGDEKISHLCVSPNHFIHMGGTFTNIMNIKTASYISKGGSDIFITTVDRNMFGWGRSYSLSAATTIMCGDTITLSASPNDSYLNYSWTPASVIVNPALASVQVFPSATGSIKSTASLSGCSISDSVIISVTPLPLIAGPAQSMSCGGSVLLNASLSVPVSGVSYLWSPAGSLNNPAVYNPVASPSLTTTYTVTASKGVCQSTATTVVNLGALPADSICLVTVDDSINKNLIVFEKHTLGPIAYYKVYKETFVANVYDSIGIVHPDSAGFFWDTLSNPAVKADRYKISIVDSCGFESVLSPEHKTMHLSINQGTGISWNLLWSAYTGFSVPTYRIWRGPNLASLTLIDSVPGTSVSYTDQTPPPGGLYYMVEVIAPKTCYPYLNTKAATSYNSSRSNQADNGLIQPVIVNALFSGTPQSGNSPLAVSFTDNSTGSPTAWHWDFGDGDTSNIQNPQHTYTSPGLYTVKLIAWNSTSIDSLIEVDYIAVSNSVPEHSLIASFKVFPNPAHDGDLSFYSGIIPMSSLSITDISGRLILQIEELNSKEYRLSANTLQRGVYLIQARLENGSRVHKKLIVN